MGGGMRWIELRESDARLVQRDQGAVVGRGEVGRWLRGGTARAQDAALGRAERHRSLRIDRASIPHTFHKRHREPQDRHECPQPAYRGGLNEGGGDRGELIEPGREGGVRRGQRRRRSHLEHDLRGGRAAGEARHAFGQATPQVDHVEHREGVQLPGVAKVQLRLAFAQELECGAKPTLGTQDTLRDRALHAQIARGQEIFNSRNANGRSCNGCHNTANNGTRFDSALFDIGTASFEARPTDFPLYTFRNRTTGVTRQLTDAGRGNITGLWDDLGKFKTPTLRALAARAPYFHNGIAPTLTDVVLHYEKHLFFVYTDQERADLVAFLNAL